MLYLFLVMKLKRGQCIFWSFFIDLRSATSMDNSHRNLLNDMAEPRSILKNDQKCTTPVLVSHQKQVQNPLKQVFHFYCESVGFPPFFFFNALLLR